MRDFTFFFLLFLTPAYAALAQIDNSAFYDIQKLNPADSNTLKLQLNALGFNKNMEYFNDIADGYTAFGYQFAPTISYQPLRNFSLSAGFTVRKDFGDRGIKNIQPLFRFMYQRDSMQLIFGNLNGGLTHRLIEPLYDFDKALLNPIENGIQFRYFQKSWWVDAWIDWQKMIYEGDPVQEEVTGGISFEKSVLSFGNTSVFLPIQALIYHKGGQIDSSPNELVTFWNSAAGLRLEGRPEGFLKRWQGSFYYTNFYDYSFEKEQPFDDGEGLYFNASATTHFDLQVMLSYWHGDEFMSIMGGQLYPSVGSVYKNQGYIEEERELLILRFSHEIHIYKGIHIASRFEPLYDIGNQTFEFSHGLYINYRQPVMLLKNVKK